MLTSDLPAPWMIEEIERLRRIRETDAGERAQIPLYPPEPPRPLPRSNGDESGRRSTVIVIDLC